MEEYKTNNFVNIAGEGKRLREVLNPIRVPLFEKRVTNFNVTFSRGVCSCKSNLISNKAHHLMERKRIDVRIFACFFGQVTFPPPRGSTLYDVIEAKIEVRIDEKLN